MFENLESILIFIITLAVVSYWLRYMKIKELALTHCKKRCDQKNYTLLDETVTLNKTKLAFRNNHFIISREFYFDYTAASNIRCTGKVVLINNIITSFRWNLEATSSSPRTTPDKAKIIPFPHKKQNH